MKNDLRLVTLFIFLIGLIGLTGTVGATQPNTLVCHSTLVDQQGYELDRFFGYGQDTNHACSDAIAQCKRELVRRGGTLMCRIHPSTNPTNPRPPRYPRTTTCQVSLKNYYGQIIRTYLRTGPNYRQACQFSDRMCKEELNFRRRNRGNFGEYCERLNVSRNPHQVTRTCRVNRQDPIYGTVQVHYGQARGQRATNVMARACSIALARCHQVSLYGQICLIAP